MGRTKYWTERMNVTLPKGATAKIKAAVIDGEDSLVLIREAIEKELIRRGKAKKGDITRPPSDAGKQG